jgi:hypothetical protein
MVQGLVKDNLVFVRRADLRRFSARNKLTVRNGGVRRDEPLSGSFRITTVVEIQIVQNPVDGTIVDELGVAGPASVHPWR